MDEKVITSYKSVKRASETDEIVINKSRFIGYAMHTMTEDDAKRFLAKVGERHPEASCICHAYICGMTQNVQKFYDGHEPVGGMPILEVMKMKGLTAVTCAVVRYFGGVKLGVGGLARAFGGAAVKAIDMAQTCEYVLSRKYKLTVDYTYQGKLEYMLGNSHFETGTTSYTDKISMEIMTKHDEYEELNSRISAITNGNHELSQKEEFYKNWDD
jgi:uncharacterized YigZ family protein